MRPKYHIRDVISWDSIRRLDKLVACLNSAANQIEDLGVNICDMGVLNDALRQRTGISFYKLRDCCDKIMEIKYEQINIARDFQDVLDGSINKQTEVYEPDFSI
jgi:hypothetical protein